MERGNPARAFRLGLSEPVLALSEPGLPVSRLQLRPARKSEITKRQQLKPDKIDVKIT